MPRLVGEVGRTSGQLRLFAAVVTGGANLDVIIDSADAASAAGPAAVAVADGPVLVFAASNFPLAFSVLGEGGTPRPRLPVVHRWSPRPTDPTRNCPGKWRIWPPKLSRISDCRRASSASYSGTTTASLPSGTARIKAYGFTGSTAGGRFLFDVASGRPDPVSLLR